MFEIGEAWLVWQALQEGRGGGPSSASSHSASTASSPPSQPDAQFGRVLAAYGGVLVAGSLAWGMALDGFRPDHSDVVGVAVCLVGVGLIMYGPR